MAKQDLEKRQLMNITQVATVFTKYFDEKSIGVIANVARGEGLTWFKTVVKNNEEKGDVDKDLMTLGQDVIYAMEHPNEPESQSLIDFVNFMTDFKRIIMHRTVDGVYAQSYLTQLEELVTDSQVKFNLFKMFSIVNLRGSEAQKLLLQLLAKNGEKATIEDWGEILRNQQGQEHFDTLMLLFEQMENAFVREIQAELQKKPYNINKLQQMCNSITKTAVDIYRLQWFGEDKRKVDTWYSEIRQKYELSTILSSTMEQITDLPKSGYAQAAQMVTQIAELEAQISRLKIQFEKQEVDKSAEIQRLVRELETIKQTLADAQAQNQTLNAENSALRQDNAKLVQSRASREAQVKKLTKAAQGMKASLFSRGVNDFKKLAEEIEHGIDQR